MKKPFIVTRTQNGLETGIFCVTRGREIFEDFDFKDFLKNGHWDDNPESEDTPPPPDLLNQRISDALRGAQVTRKLHFYTATQKRLMCLMHISEMANFNLELERVSNRLDREITQEALCLNIPLLAIKRNWMEDNPMFDPEWYGDDNNGARLTQLTGNTLLEKVDETDAQEMVERLNTLLDMMIRRLCEIRRKIKGADELKREEFFFNLMKQYDQKWVEYKYKQWKDDRDDITMKTLSYKQHQLIVELLSTGFCRNIAIPSEGEVSQRAIVISAEAMAHGTPLPEGIAEECAKFERFAEWEQGILRMRYARLGRYIIKHYAQLQESDLRNICHFIIIIDLIQEDIVSLCPKLSKHLTTHELSVSKQMKLVKKALKPLKAYLRKGLRESLPDEFVTWLLYDSDLKHEARQKLMGKSNAKYLCEMVLVLSLKGVFGSEADTKTMTKALMPAMGRLPQTTVRRYLQGMKEAMNGSLYAHAGSVIDQLKQKPYNALAGIL